LPFDAVVPVGQMKTVMSTARLLMEGALIPF